MRPSPARLAADASAGLQGAGVSGVVAGPPGGRLDFEGLEGAAPRLPRWRFAPSLSTSVDCLQIVQPPCASKFRDSSHAGASHMILLSQDRKERQGLEERRGVSQRAVRLVTMPEIL